MPSGPAHLRKKFMTQDDDGIQKCHRLLDQNFIIHKGMIRPLTASYIPNQEEDDAIDYLVLEWDYGFEPIQLGADSSMG